MGGRKTQWFQFYFGEFFVRIIRATPVEIHGNIRSEKLFNPGDLDPTFDVIAT